MLDKVRLDPVEMRSWSVRVANEVDDSEITAALLRSALHLLYVRDNVIFDLLCEEAERGDAGVRQVFLERKIQSRRRRRPEARITRQDVSAIVHHRRRSDLLESGTGNRG